jgi:hypothetical protein
MRKLSLKSISVFIITAISVFFANNLIKGFCEDINSKNTLQNSFIWVDSVPEGTQAYVEFRKDVSLDGIPQKAVINIFADTRYFLWVNGTYIERGPCRFDPKIPEYDTIDITKHLKSGANSIAVLVHHYHDGLAAEDSSSALNSRSMRHQPGFTAEIEISSNKSGQKKYFTNDSWLVNTVTCYKQSLHHGAVFLILLMHAFKMVTGQQTISTILPGKNQ